MPNEPSVTWKAYGQTLSEPTALINVIEHRQSVTIDGTPGPYGIPIDAPLAVTQIKALREIVARQPAENELRQLIEGSFAITLDKNVLLKTLSQPKCEGIRFYLCVKKATNHENVLSLVTVGVDEAGKDLLYEYEAGTPVEEIPTRSLVAEYGFPPGRLNATTTMDPFVLFKFSE